MLLEFKESIFSIATAKHSKVNCLYKRYQHGLHPSKHDVNGNKRLFCSKFYVIEEECIHTFNKENTISIARTKQINH